MKTKHNSIRSIVSASALVMVMGMVITGNANAAVIPCAVTDMTFNGANSNQCFGPVSGNDAVADINSNFGAGWSFLLRDNVGTAGDGVGNFNGIDFALSPVAGKDGSWTLSWDDNGTNILPQTLDLAAVLKASSNFNGYLFSGLNFADAPASGTGTWDINFLNNGGKVPDLSHFSLYIRGDIQQRIPPLSIPEPESLALMGLGLLSLVALRRRATK